MSLEGKWVLITGAARRVGRALALAVGAAGGDVLIHYDRSQAEAESARDELLALGRRAVILQADLDDPAASRRFDRARPGARSFIFVGQ